MPRYGRTRAAVAMALFGMLPVLFGAGSPAAGTWDCVAGTPNGDMSWTLVVTEKDGALSGTISGELGEFQLTDVEFHDGTLTFKVTIDEATYTVKVRIEENKLDGAWEGADASGTIAGKRRTA